MSWKDEKWLIPIEEGSVSSRLQACSAFRYLNFLLQEVGILAIATDTLAIDITLHETNYLDILFGKSFLHFLDTATFHSSYILFYFILFVLFLFLINMFSSFFTHHSCPNQFPFVRCLVSVNSITLVSSSSTVLFHLHIKTKVQPLFK